MTDLLVRLKGLVDEVADRSNLSPITLCKEYLKDPYLYQRLEEGNRKITLDKLEKSLIKMIEMKRRLDDGTATFVRDNKFSEKINSKEHAKRIPPGDEAV
ncbi:MAG: hypothetical protein OXD01_05040 [Gammaproteobacteria bacterium]|nr:hypothetical protein [Gammaproteobacteria bacterium]